MHAKDEDAIHEAEKTGEFQDSIMEIAEYGDIKRTFVIIGLRELEELDDNQVKFPGSGDDSVDKGEG